jgi:hypothetical protein
MRQTIQERVDEYRAKAREASALAGASVLSQVRERHKAAALAWAELAEAEDERAEGLSQRFGRAAEEPQTREPQTHEPKTVGTDTADETPCIA